MGTRNRIEKRAEGTVLRCGSMMLGFKFKEHNLSAGPAVMEDGEINAEVDQNMSKSPSKTGRANERNQEITDDKKTNPINL